MGSWSCPNNKCTYDKQLQPRQDCPLCGKAAKEFNFSEFGNLLREKWDYKKSMERTEYPLEIEEHERIEESQLTMSDAYIHESWEQRVRERQLAGEETIGEEASRVLMRWTIGFTLFL